MIIMATHARMNNGIYQLAIRGIPAAWQHRVIIPTISPMIPPMLRHFSFTRSPCAISANGASNKEYTSIDIQQSLSPNIENPKHTNVMTISDIPKMAQRLDVTLSEYVRAPHSRCFLRAIKMEVGIPTIGMANQSQFQTPFRVSVSNTQTKIVTTTTKYPHIRRMLPPPR